MDSAENSRVAKLINEHIEEILSHWEKRIRENIKNAKQLRRPILIDTAPAYLGALAKYLLRNGSLAVLEESEDVASEHGGERARLSQYVPSDVIAEYQILRNVVIETLEAKMQSLSVSTRSVIHAYIDFSVRSAVTSFELVQARIREQYIATLTHDLRNPLGAADMAADLILDEISDPKQIHFLVGKVRENIKRVNRMIQDLLDSSLAREGHRLRLEIVESDFGSVLNETIRDLSLTHGRRFNWNGKSIKGHFDPNAFTRALENMCVNAIKYGAPGKQITVQMECIGERVIVSVHNYGKTIPIEEQESIFQPYQRAALARNGGIVGWGLGLPLVRAVAESHGGSIAVTSNEIDGTTFTFDIPVDARPFQNAPVTE